MPGARSDWRVRPVAPAMAAFSRARDIGPIAYSRAFLGRRLLRVLHPSSRRCHYYYYYHRSARDVYLYELPVVPARLVRATRSFHEQTASGFPGARPDGVTRTVVEGRPNSATDVYYIYAFGKRENPGYLDATGEQSLLVSNTPENTACRMYSVIDEIVLCLEQRLAIARSACGLPSISS